MTIDKLVTHPNPGTSCQANSFILQKVCKATEFSRGNDITKVARYMIFNTSTCTQQTVHYLYHIVLSQKNCLLVVNQGLLCYIPL